MAFVTDGICGIHSPGFTRCSDCDVDLVHEIPEQDTRVRKRTLRPALCQPSAPHGLSTIRNATSGSRLHSSSSESTGRKPARRPEPTCTLIMGRIRYSTSVYQYQMLLERPRWPEIPKTSGPSSISDAEEIAKAVDHENVRFVPIKTDDQLDLQGSRRRACAVFWRCCGRSGSRWNSSVNVAGTGDLLHAGPHENICRLLLST